MIYHNRTALKLPQTPPTQEPNPKTLFLRSLLVPFAIVLVAWVVKILEILFHLELEQFGIFPLKISGLPGIFLSPFIHADFNHLINNSIPLLVLGTALHFFYKDIALRVWFFSFLITGIWVWFFARDAYHIGASGVVYSLALFIFVSGAIRRHPRLMAISLLVAFLYGSMFWGIFPIKDRISWESHLMGALSGIVLAVFFRNQGPQRKIYDFELEEENDEEEDDYDADENGEEEPRNHHQENNETTTSSRKDYFSPPTLS